MRIKSDLNINSLEMCGLTLNLTSLEGRRLGHLNDTLRENKINQFRL
jgi:hypothetical protein